MKRVFNFSLILFSCLTLAGCQSKEDKANKLIDEYMFKHLHDYKSYEVVETTVDTLYNTPLLDSKCIEAAIASITHDTMADEYEKAAARNKSTMEIWSDGWSSTAKSEYNKAKEEYISNQCLLITEKIASMKSWKVITNRCKELNGEEMIGWLVEHSYRCNNRGGNSVLCDKLFLIDPNFKEIVSSYDSDDENNNKAINLISSIIQNKEITEEMLDSLIVQYEDLLERWSKNRE